MGVAGKENSDRVLELNRLVIMGNGKNLASYLVGNSLRKLPRDLFVVSYADLGWGHVGYVYQATNFIYTGMTNERTDMASSSGHSRHNDGDPTKRQFRSAKHRYIYLTGNKKKQIKNLLYQARPYPKGESRKYNTDAPEPMDARLMICS